MRRIDRYRRRSESRDAFNTLEDLYQLISYGGNQYLLPTQTLTGGKEDIENNYDGYVKAAYKSNGVVFACILARMMLFSEARFQWQQLRNGVPGDLFGTSKLAEIERPSPGKTTRELLAKIEQHVSLAGNAYITRNRNTRSIVTLRPDWVTIVNGSRNGADPRDGADELEWEVTGYMYHPGGPRAGRRPTMLDPSEVAHFSPIPDPAAINRGMSWLTPITRNVQAHSQATTHKSKFFENGASPNMVVSFDPSVNFETFQRFKEDMDAGHKGALNAYKTLYLGGGADVTVVGNSFQQMAFKETQGADETLICAASGVPAIIVGVSEGLNSATYSNYGQARRKFGDHWARPQWGGIAASLETLFAPPGNDVRLWYDDRNIAFLREDRTDEVAILREQSLAIRSLSDAGYLPNTVIDAVVSGDLRRLEHSGLYSVQLQKPLTEAEVIALV